MLDFPAKTPTISDVTHKNNKYTSVCKVVKSMFLLKEQ
jgi:hypothetical protein